VGNCGSIVLCGKGKGNGVAPHWGASDPTHFHSEPAHPPCGCKVEGRMERHSVHTQIIGNVFNTGVIWNQITEVLVKASLWGLFSFRKDFQYIEQNAAFQTESLRGSSRIEGWWMHSYPYAADYGEGCFLLGASSHFSVSDDQLDTEESWSQQLQRIILAKWCKFKSPSGFSASRINTNSWKLVNSELEICQRHIRTVFSQVVDPAVVL
jgi:hypothetical protein